MAEDAIANIATATTTDINGNATTTITDATVGGRTRASLKGYTVHAKARLNHERSARSVSSLRKALSCDVKIAALLVVVLSFQSEAAIARVHNSHAAATQSPIVLRPLGTFSSSGGLNHRWGWGDKSGAELIVVLRNEVRVPDPYLADLRRGHSGPRRFQVLETRNIVVCKSITANLVIYKDWPFTHTPKSYSMFVVISGKQYIVTYTNIPDLGKLPAYIASYFRNFCGIDNAPESL